MRTPGPGAEEPQHSLVDLPAPAGVLAAQSAPATTIRVAGRRLVPTAVFPTYWRFAAARQELYEARQKRPHGPWTADPVLARHRFTNCYRACDRVSQFLINRVSYTGDQQPQEVVFRTLLFKLFNRTATWQLLTRELGELSWAEYDTGRYENVLGAASARGERLYSAAYVMAPPRLGAPRKYANHLRLLELMMNSGVTERVLSAGSLHGVFEVLRGYPGIGNFLGYQFAIDLNYSTVLDHAEAEYVVAGPGARDGIRKCFGPTADGIEADVIRYMAEHQDEHFTGLGVHFPRLRGRPLQLVDCQNLFCEVDKYARVAYPDIAGHSGGHRIKQRYRPAPGLAAPGWFPPKWGIN